MNSSPEGETAAQQAVQVVGPDQAAQQDSKQLSWWSRGENWQKCKTVVEFFFAAAIVGFTGVQTFITWSTLDEMRLESRPWLSVSTVKVEKLVANKQIELTLECNASGNSPAKVRNLKLSSEIVPRGDTRLFDAFIAKHEAALMNSVVADVVTAKPWFRRHQMSRAATPKRLERLGRNVWQIWIVGRIEYTDSLGGSHFTDFRFASEGDVTNGGELTLIDQNME